MPIVFWIIVAAGFLGGAFLSARWGAAVLARIAVDTKHEKSIQRAGRIAGFVAVIPSLLLAALIGGNFGGALAVNLAAQLPENSLAQQTVMGLGIGLGAMLVLCLLIVSTVAAAATFMKVHLAKDPVQK